MVVGPSGDPRGLRAELSLRGLAIADPSGEEVEVGSSPGAIRTGGEMRRSPGYRPNHSRV